MSQHVEPLTGPITAPAPPVDADLQIKPYQAGMVPAILELILASLGSAPATPPTPEFWQWKHQANPFGPSYGLAAWDEPAERLAGLRVLMRWEFRGQNNERVAAVRAVDTATHAAYRRQGLFSQLTYQAVSELTATGIQLIFNTPNAYSLPGYLKLGWQVVETWPVYLKLLQPMRLLFRLARRGTAPAAPLPFTAYFKPGILTWDAFARRYGQAIPGLVAGWEAQRRHTGYRTHRDETYLHWRYGRHPHLHYGVFPLEQAGRLAGLAILRPNLRYGLQEIVMTEIFLAEPDAGLGRQLIQQLTRQLKGDYLAAHFSRESWERQLLRQNGFARLPGKGIPFTVRPLNPPLSLPLSPRSWDLSLGDLEIF